MQPIVSLTIFLIIGFLVSDLQIFAKQDTRSDLAVRESQNETRGKDHRI